METKTEIDSLIKNSRYYLNKLQELAKRQFEIDLRITLEKDVNSTALKIRTMGSGIILANCSWIDSYLTGIETIASTMQEQDEKLLKPELEEVSVAEVKIEQVFNNESNPLYNNLNKEL